MLPDLHKLSVNTNQTSGLNMYSIDMKRKRVERPVGVDDHTWKMYRSADKLVPGKARLPRFAYRNWTDNDIQKCLQQNTLHSSPGKPHRLVPYTSPPSMDELIANDNAWILNVKPPWATALAFGLKNVENRTWGFEGFRWTFVAASAQQSARYSMDNNDDMNTRLKQSGQSEWIGKFPIDIYQHIVGLVKLRAYDFEQFTYDKGLCSVWYNGMHPDEIDADIALHVEEAFAFKDPIPYKGCLGMVKLATVAQRDPIIMNALKRQLQLIGSAGPSAMDSDDDMDDVEDKPPQAPQVPAPGLTRPLPPLPDIPPPFANMHVEVKEITSLDVWGCMAWAIEYPQASITSFIHELNTGAQEWMANHLKRALLEPPRKPEYAHGHQIWQNTDPSIQQTILNSFDLRTRDGMIRLFDPTLRKTSIPEPVRLYVNKCLEYAKQGMNVTAQGNSHKGWTKTGFGIWTRIWTSTGINMLLKVKSMLMTKGFNTHISGVPHIIYKPPRGENLTAHHDQIPTMKLIENLRAHVASPDPSVKAWASMHGIQLLAHIHGGYEDGYTYTVGPLDCRKLLFCMELIVKNPSDIAAAAWSTSNKYETFTTTQSGPYFVDWLKLVGQNGDGPLNTHLIKEGHERLHIVPIRPFTNDGKPYLAMWPVGFPHGSMSNKEPRVTLTMNLTLKAVELEPRVIKRLKNLAILAHTGSSDTEVATAEADFQADTKPYHDGGTHKMPEMMADLQRNATYARDGKRVGPFASIAPTREDVKAFRNALYEV